MRSRGSTMDTTCMLLKTNGGVPTVRKSGKRATPAGAHLGSKLRQRRPVLGGGFMHEPTAPTRSPAPLLRTCAAHRKRCTRPFPGIGAVSGMLDQ